VIIGTNTPILPEFKIVANVTIRALAVATMAVPANPLAVDLPAKTIKHKDNVRDFT
jgi:serine acetyltransferase